MSSLSDSNVLITGAAKGIGAAVARACVGAGARVGVLDTDSGAAEALVAELGDGALALTANVSDYGEVAAAADALRAEFGPITGLVANAGIAQYALMSEGDPESWRRLLEVNVLGAAYAVRAVVGPMKEAERGHLVLMSSIAGREAWIGEPIYIASKHAMVGMGHSLRKECAEHRVGVTLVEPAIVDTPLVRSTEEGREELDRYAALDPADVGNAVVFALAQPPGVGVSEMVLRALGPEA
ncbi:MAG TPA: SDR family oxidoreductase [Solirubrobacterales bacterium]|nr:SDR family oxidoreductase [Solirubrobacterales bacterium]